MSNSDISNLPSKKFFSTGEVAKICAVKRDTVLKWIKSQKIFAKRTAGGHHRVTRQELLSFLHLAAKQPPLQPEASQFQFCWQFHSDSGRILPDCQKCITFRSRTIRCYELARIPKDIGHVRLFCKEQCEECDYYKTVQSRPLNILILAKRNVSNEAIEREAVEHGCNIRFTDSEYICSMLIDSFHPDYFVIDSSIGPERVEILVDSFKSDPRTALTEFIIIDGDVGSIKNIDRTRFKFVNGPLSLEALYSLINVASLPRAAI